VAGVHAQPGQLSRCTPPGRCGGAAEQVGAHRQARLLGVHLYRLGADGRINWHFFVTDWKDVRLQLPGEAPDLPVAPARRAVLVKG
jgi:hypothetical protein